MMIACAHESHQKYGKTRKGEQRHRCNLCGHVWFDAQPKLLGEMRVPVETAKLALRLLVEGMSIRATVRTTGIDKARSASSWFSSAMPASGSWTSGCGASR